MVAHGRLSSPHFLRELKLFMRGPALYDTKPTKIMYKDLYGFYFSTGALQQEYHLYYINTNRQAKCPTKTLWIKVNFFYFES